MLLSESLGQNLQGNHFYCPINDRTWVFNFASLGIFRSEPTLTSAILQGHHYLLLITYWTVRTILLQAGVFSRSIDLITNCILQLTFFNSSPFGQNLRYLRKSIHFRFPLKVNWPQFMLIFSTRLILLLPHLGRSNYKPFIIHHIQTTRIPTPQANSTSSTPKILGQRQQLSWVADR